MECCFLIEPMSIADLEHVVEIENRSFLSPWSQRLFEEELTNPCSRVFLAKRQAEKELEVIGYICLWLVSDEVHILKIAVHPSARRAGVASTLLQFSLDYSCQRNIVKAVLEVREHNHSARCFYGTCGFSLLGIRPRYYDDTKENALIMGLDLRSFAGGHEGRGGNIPQIRSA